MRFKSTLFIFLASTTIIFGQSDFGLSSYDKAMISMAKEIAIRTRTKAKVKVALWYFTDTRGEKSVLGDYIARDFSIHFTNEADVFEVFDRDHLDQYLEEHKLNEIGFINPQTAKKIGMLTAADAIITGTVDVGLHHLRLRLKLINTETGGQIAAAIRSVPIDKNLEVILEEVEFYRPIINKKTPNPNERSNDSRSTNKECERLEVGDYCFENKTNEYLLIDINSLNGKSNGSISVSPMQTECFYGLPKGDYVSRIYVNVRSLAGDTKGTLRINKCESLTKIIR